MGFGANPEALARLLSLGWPAYLQEQLNPLIIDDSAAEAMIPATIDDWDWTTRRQWYCRMVYSKRQLQEKMTLLWHEHFAVSNEKVANPCFMQTYENFLRTNALGNFRDLLIGMTKNQAMLRWLDNDYNNGQAYDSQGKLIPPNENYARELMQLFSLGSAKLRLNGTPITDANGIALQPYTEIDVQQIARAITGWHTNYDQCGASEGVFESYLHDPGSKTILGVTLNGRSGTDGALEVEDVINILMGQPTLAPYIAKMLIQKLATETPTKSYVRDVAAVFRSSNGDIKATVQALFLHPDFGSSAVVRSQFRTPLEYLVGGLRALGAYTEGSALNDWGARCHHGIYYPPSVFSFYRPGSKVTLVNTSLVTMRDRIADEMTVSWGYWGTYFDAQAMITTNNLQTPAQCVDFLTDRLLTASVQKTARAQLISYMAGQVTEDKFRGVTWLILCSPDFQRN